MSDHVVQGPAKSGWQPGQPSTANHVGHLPPSDPPASAVATLALSRSSACLLGHDARPVAVDRAPLGLLVGDPFLVVTLTLFFL